MSERVLREGSKEGKRHLQKHTGQGDPSDPKQEVQGSLDSKGEAGRRVTRLKLVSSDRLEAYVVQRLDEEGPATRARSSDSHDTEICVGWKGVCSRRSTVPAALMVKRSNESRGPIVT